MVAYTVLYKRASLSRVWRECETQLIIIKEFVVHEYGTGAIFTNDCSKHDARRVRRLRSDWWVVFEDQMSGDALAGVLRQACH